MLVFTFEDDEVVAINSPDAKEILEETFGAQEITKRRATHIVPQNPLKRLIFKIVRFVTGDGQRFHALENWTRRWRCLQLVDLRPSNGPVVGPFPSRQAAIDWEIAWLQENL